MPYDPVVKEHQEWLGFLQPIGLVVSPTALKNAQARIARNVTREQEILLRHTHEIKDDSGNAKRRLNRFSEFAKEFWSWEDADLAGPPDALSTALQEYGEILRPEFAVPGVKGECDWQILVQELPASATLDLGGQGKHERSWQASPQARFERLLRDTAVPIGLLVNPDAIRLVYAPKGETAGHITFPIHAMCETAGRPIVAALHLLLDAQRLFALPKDQRLPAILQASRKYQNEVSIKLSGQVLRALNELCRGFNDANRATRGELLAQTLREAPEVVYGGLLTTLMRLVFLLYAEDRNLMASDETYQRCYGIIGLYEKLREDAADYPDTIDQRFGAWAQFLTLSRLVHDGGGHGGWRLPARRGRLFDPDCYAFLEGRAHRSQRKRNERITAPKVSDGVLYRVLEDLLHLDGERISYRALDVEQIGSVYEAMMGFEVKRADGPSIGFKPDHVVVNLQDLIEQPAADRKKWVKEHVGWEPAEKAAQALKTADSMEAILGAISSRVSYLYADRELGTVVVTSGDIYLQPTEERRRSGSHYTPRSLTEPIVKTTLDPVLKQLGENPTPEQILNLKVCDPAMGSGAFLVEACRYLGDALESAWIYHNKTPDIPTDQDPLLHARRMVAQRCLYGVDKNQFAVDLAKLSLWLATFAKDHPFTFLDHSFRQGDSLVGLTFNEIVDALGDKSTLFRPLAEARIEEAIGARLSILDSVEDTPYDLLETKYEVASQSVGTLRDLGDAMVAAFFLESKAKDRSRIRRELAEAFDHSKFDVLVHAVNALRQTWQISPFHWETELPEVFRNGGFNAIVGNPPFAGSTMLAQAVGSAYTEWLRETYPDTGGKCDLVAFFFRRSYSLLLGSGALGLLATKTIAQGDTRSSGLMQIVKDGGVIYNASSRLTWPGPAAVVVSVVHLMKRPHLEFDRVLNGRPVARITSYLVHLGTDDEPARLLENLGVAFLGTKPGAKAFVFGEKTGNLSMSLVPKTLGDARNLEVVRPYIGGDEFNDSPTFAPRRFIIDFADSSIETASSYRDVFELLKTQFKTAQKASKWWQFARRGVALYQTISGLGRVLAVSETCNLLAFGFMTNDRVFSNSLYIFAFDQWQAFAICQSRIHERWVRVFASSFKDDQRYVGADCFETFPLPSKWKESEHLAVIGEQYHCFRAQLMAKTHEGLTETYNRFHHKYEENEDIKKLQELHAQMDRAVLDAYGWTDLQPTHHFILDYEEADDEQENGRARRRKEPWRYRWADDFRDEVLARLLELNRQRAEEERRAVPPVKLPSSPKKPRKRKDDTTIDMFAAKDSE